MGKLYFLAGKKSITLGRDIRNDIVISDPFVSKIHMILDCVDDDFVSVAQVSGRNGIVVNDELIRAGRRVEITRSDVLTIGKVVFVWLGKYLYIESSSNGSKAIITNVESRLKRVYITEFPCGLSEKEKKRFSPAIRQINSFDYGTIEIEEPPSRRQPEKVSALMAAGPALAMAIPMILGYGRMLSVASSLIAASFTVMNVVMRKRKFKNEERRRRNSYMAYINELDAKICERYEAYGKYLLREFPTASAYLESGGNPNILWNRPADSRFHNCYRIGRGINVFPVEISIPKFKFSQIDDSLKELPGRIKSKYEYIDNTPIWIDRTKMKFLAIVSGKADRIVEITSALIVWMMMVNSPDDMCIKVDFDSNKYTEDMAWIMKSPHYLSKEREDLIRRRWNNEEVVPFVMTITDNSEVLAEKVRDNKNFGILVKNNKYHLPAFLEAVLEEDDENNAFILDTVTGNRKKIVVDTLSVKKCSEYVRIMRRIWPEDAVSDEEIPEVVAFDRLFNEFPDTNNVIDNWCNISVVDSLAFPIGISKGGKKICLDMHEKAHGPHGLIAGSTGSGKSELLTTIVLAASLLYPPDKVGFFLIDYKGGGMSNQFAGLPHLMGSISNLSASEAMRALKSLRSENIRRQEMFIENGVNNIGDYIRKYEKNELSEPLAHILIIIDEFAELKKENPEFIQELISIAAVGRSVGIHLILATQKPAGVVDEKIRSNARFRICLRVEGKADSQDMLHTSDAADINRCGRAYMQVGNDEIYTLFQSGYAMGKKNSEDSEIRLEICDRNGRIVKKYEKADEEEDGKTWHEQCMDNICKADIMLKIKHPKRLWLPPLKEIIYAPYALNEDEDEKDDDYENEESQSKSFTLGIADDPERQRYVGIKYYMEDNEHLCVIGPGQSGKSNFLVCLLEGLIRSLSADEVNLYIMDFGGGKLKAYENAAICGGYIGNDTKKRTRMMLNHLCDELNLRKRGISCNGQLLLLVIDNFGEIADEIDEKIMSVFSDICRYGKTFGIRLIITGMEIGQKDVPSSIINFIDRMIFLGRNDIYRIASCLSVAAREIPAIGDVPGRGLVKNKEDVLEFQTYYFPEDQIDIKGVEKISSAKARQYPYIPDNPSIEAFMERVGDEANYDCTYKFREERKNDNINVPAGYEKESGKIYRLPFDIISCILISGRKDSGQNNLIEVINLILARMSIKTINVYNVNTLLNILKTVEEEPHFKEHLYLIVSDLNKLLTEFYDNPFDDKQEILLSKYLDNKIKKRSVSIAGIIDNTINRTIKDTPVFKSLFNRPYVIYLGGCLDEQKIFDFSYLSYSQQAEKKNNNIATVIKYDRRIFRGDIIIPYIEEEEIKYDYY